jgi:transcriptional regulator of acetoin/glycerol metabolism
MSPKMQLAMLKVIDLNKASTPKSAGGTHFNIRILAASHHHLEERVKAGNFREELYFRLNVVELTIPPPETAAWRYCAVEELLSQPVQQRVREIGGHHFRGSDLSFSILRFSGQCPRA